MDTHKMHLRLKVLCLAAAAFPLCIALPAVAQSRATGSGSVVIEQPVGGTFAYSLSTAVVTAIFLERSEAGRPAGSGSLPQQALFSSYVGYRPLYQGRIVLLASDALGGTLHKASYRFAPSFTQHPDWPLLFIAQFN